jgi:penicillin amidase
MTLLRPRLAAALQLFRATPACLAAAAIAAASVGGCSDEGEEEPSTAASATAASTGATTAPASSSSGGEGGGGGASGITIPELEGEVTAITDEHGVLHLQCAADDDCFAALGWFHAQNRFFFMDFVRNLVRGSLGGLVKAGPIVLETDYENRRFFSTREGEPLEQALYDQASDKVKGHFDAYSRGVNAWIEDMRAGENGATLTTEYDFSLIVKEAIRDWEPADSAAVGLYVLNDLSNNSPDELVAGAAVPLFDAAFAGDLFSGEPVTDAFTIDGGAEAAPFLLPPSVTRRLGADRSLIGSAATRLDRLGSGRRAAGDTGSNNWAVAPDRSASGNSILANDPHLPLTNPSIWFPAEIDARSEGDGDYHMAGGTFPGLPAVLIGHNEDLAWGVTTAYWDLADVYQEELSADGSAVIFDGEEVPILEREFEFADSSSDEPKTQTFRWVPHHGPIIAEDLEAGTAVSVRWRGHDGGSDLDGFFAIARSATVEEARDALAEFGSSANQNFVIADAEGIGWFPYSRVPRRPWASPELPPWLPLPGDGSAEWGDPVPMEDLPQLLHPSSGVIATANQDMTGAWADGDPTDDGQDAIQAYSRGEGTRQQRILDLLEEGGDQHTPATLTAIQGDDYSLYGELVVPVLLAATAAATLDADATALVEALEAWSYTCPTGIEGDDPAGDGVEDAELTAEAVGCTAFHVAWFALREAAVGDEIEAAEAVGFTASNLVARALREPEALATGELLWDDVSTDAVETRDDIALATVIRAGALLAELGDDADAWRWGRHHSLSLRSIYDEFDVETYNETPRAAPGCMHCVNVANPCSTLPEESADLDLAFKNGASIRLVTEITDDGPRMTFQLPGGADLHRESDFYNNLLPRWLVNEPTDFAFGPGAVEDPAETVTLRAE